MNTITTHTIVKNEERFIWYALNSVAPFVEEMIIYDTGSSDRTIELIEEFITKNKIDYPKLKVQFEKMKISNPEEIGQLRIKQVKQTKTPWFLLLDGDEIWGEDQLAKLLNLTDDLNSKVLAVVNKTRNCAGDIYHYLPDSFGKYTFLGKTGHYNIRLMKTTDYEIKGVYPNEGYYFQDKLVNSQDEWLSMSDSWYLHTSHLKRSSVESNAFGRRKQIYATGIKLEEDELPEVFSNRKLDSIPNLSEHRSFVYEIVSKVIDVLRGVFR